MYYRKKPFIYRADLTFDQNAIFRILPIYLTQHMLNADQFSRR